MRDSRADDRLCDCGLGESAPWHHGRARNPKANHEFRAVARSDDTQKPVDLTEPIRFLAIMRDGWVSEHPFMANGPTVKAFDEAIARLRALSEAADAWEPLSYRDGSRMPPEHLRAFAALREAGCVCPLPLLGERPGVGPRCRLCSTVAAAVTNEPARTSWTLSDEDAQRVFDANKMTTCNITLVSVSRAIEAAVRLGIVDPAGAVPTISEEVRDAAVAAARKALRSPAVTEYTIADAILAALPVAGVPTVVNDFARVLEIAAERAVEANPSMQNLGQFMALVSLTLDKASGYERQREWAPTAKWVAALRSRSSEQIPDGWDGAPGVCREIITRPFSAESTNMYDMPCGMNRPCSIHDRSRSSSPTREDAR